MILFAGLLVQSSFAQRFDVFLDLGLSRTAGRTRWAVIFITTPARVTPLRRVWQAGLAVLSVIKFNAGETAIWKFKIKTRTSKFEQVQMQGAVIP